MLIAADDALDAAVDSTLGSSDRSLAMAVAKERSEVANKFKKALNLLSDFAMEFPLKNPTSYTINGGTVTGGVKNDNNAKSPMTILEALKYNLHSNVKFLSVSLYLDADNLKYQPMGYNMDPPGSYRIVRFYILESLHDLDPDWPDIVKRGCRYRFCSCV